MAKNKAKAVSFPAPLKVEGKLEWYPAARIGQRIPFGYRKDPDDSQLIWPIEKELLLLEEAKKLLKKGHSYRDVANWLSYHSGRSISHVGLMHRVKADKGRRRRLTNTQQLIKKYEEAIEKAKKIEAAMLERKPIGSTSESETSSD